MEERDREEIFSKRIRAGKRTYFFDVKSTKANDYYITITESRRYQKEDGFGYEKHKMFLYKEDFDKFLNALTASVDHVKTELMPDYDFSQYDRDPDENREAVTESTLEMAPEIAPITATEGSDLKWD